MSNSEIVQSVSDKLKELQLSKKVVKYLKEVEDVVTEYNKAFNEMTKCVIEHFDAGLGLYSLKGLEDYNSSNKFKNGYITDACNREARTIRDFNTNKMDNIPEDIKIYFANNSEFAKKLEEITNKKKQNYAEQKLFCFNEAAKILQKEILDLKSDVSNPLNIQSDDNAAELGLLAINRCVAVFEEETSNDKQIKDTIDLALEGNLALGGETLELPIAG